MEKIIAIFERHSPVEDDYRQYLPMIGQAVGGLALSLTANLAGPAFRSDLLLSGGSSGTGDTNLYDGRLCGSLSLWVNRVEDAALIFDALAFMPTMRTLYSVVESVPREYPTITWMAGQPSPGVTLLAVFRKKAGLTTDEFLDRWMGHSALSLKIHPLSRYHRNFVVRRLAGTGEELHGIVEERVGSIEDLAPERFYIGGPEMQAWASADIATFIDVRNSMRCNLTQEFILKLPPWLEPLRRAEGSDH
jgi:hypothetical protein